METRRIKRNITIEISVRQERGDDGRWRVGSWDDVYATLYGGHVGWGSDERDNHFGATVIRAIRGVLTAMNRDDNNWEMRELLDLDTWEVEE